MEKKLILRAKGIHKHYSQPSYVSLLKGISLDLHLGESLAIMGKSGEGKSTLLHILGTLEDPTEGTLFIAGKKVTTHNAPLIRNQHIGFVFQGFHLLEDRTVLQNVLMPATVCGKGKERQERALFLLEKVGLAHRAAFAAKLLSGGEKQRVAIARALCNDPELILADEPTGNLDEVTSKEIHALLEGLTRNLNKALIIVTHHQGLAQLCNHTLHLKGGLLE